MIQVTSLPLEVNLSPLAFLSPKSSGVLLPPHGPCLMPAHLRNCLAQVKVKTVDVRSILDNVCIRFKNLGHLNLVNVYSNIDSCVVYQYMDHTVWMLCKGNQEFKFKLSKSLPPIPTILAHECLLLQHHQHLKCACFFFCGGQKKAAAYGVETPVVWFLGHISKPLFHDFHDYLTKRFVPMTPMKSNLPEHGSSVFLNGSQRQPVAIPNLSKSNEISQMLSKCDVW